MAEFKDQQGQVGTANSFAEYLCYEADELAEMIHLASHHLGVESKSYKLMCIARNLKTEMEWAMRAVNDLVNYDQEEIIEAIEADVALAWATRPPTPVLPPLQREQSQIPTQIIDLTQEDSEDEKME